MQKWFLNIFIFTFFLALNAVAGPSVFKENPWVLYEVQRTQSLWKFAKHLGVKKRDIPKFVKEIVKANPFLKNPNLIYPNEQIFLKSSTINRFVPLEKQFRTHWMKKRSDQRSMASVQQVQYKAEGTDLFSVTPRLAFSRIDAQQRGALSKATLLSTMNVGVIGSYSWKNRWGPGGLNLDLNWSEYDEDLGQNITRNQVLLTQFEYIQGLSLSKSWMTLVSLGLYQSPYLFTDPSDNLYLKVGTQPGFGLAVQKNFLQSEISVDFKVSYFYNGYAGDTVVDEGLAYDIAFHKKWSAWGQPMNSVFRVNKRDLLTEVTSQEVIDMSLGLGIEF